MAMSSGTETFGGRPRSDVGKKPRYMLSRRGSAYVVLDTHRPEDEQEVALCESWASAEMKRIELQKAWNAEKN